MVAGRQILFAFSGVLACASPSTVLMAAEPLPGAGKAHAASHVRQCTGYGQSFDGKFWQIPGTDTCISLGGYLWAEGYYNTYTGMPQQDHRSYSISTYGFELDARTNTEYGLLRSMMDLRFQMRTAQDWGLPMPNGGAEAVLVPWRAYLQFGGLTAGVKQSTFDFYANLNIYGTDPVTVGDETHLPILAYTTEFGGGWSATLALEESSVRNEGISHANAAIARQFAARSKLPDLVGNIQQSGDWGEFQLSGALHREAAIATQGTGAGLRTWQQGAIWGYAVQAGLMFNLPQIAQGDNLYLQAAYTDGAVSYLGLVNPSGNFNPPDAFINSDGSISTVSGWNATAQYVHNFNAYWNVTLFGGYGAFELNSAEAQASLGASGGINYNFGGNIVWQATSSFSMYLQYDYNMYKARDYVNTGYGLPEPAQKASQILLMAQRVF